MECDLMTKEFQLTKNVLELMPIFIQEEFKNDINNLHNDYIEKVRQENQSLIKAFESNMSIEDITK